MSKDKNPRKKGQVITFFSYRGGTGRSMAAANVACILAQREPAKARVLLIDMDIQAPSQHFLFDGHAGKGAQSVHGTGPALYSTEGVVEMMNGWLDAKLRRHPYADGDEAKRILDKTHVADYIVETDVAGLHLMKAGLFNKTFSRRAMEVPWAHLANGDDLAILPWILAQRLTDDYDYVVIDSTAGIGSAADIAARLMSDLLVMMFVPGQSLSELAGIARRAVMERKDCHRPLTIVPVPARAELAIPERLAACRVHYQPFFEALVAELYGLESISLADHFDRVLLPETREYAFSDDIAALSEDQSKPSALLAAYKRLAEQLAAGLPWQPKPSS